MTFQILSQYELIVRRETALTENQCLNLHHCLFSPTHRFAHKRRVSRAMQTQDNLIQEMNRDASEDFKMFCSAKLFLVCGLPQSLHWLPYDPNIKKA